MFRKRSRRLTRRELTQPGGGANGFVPAAETAVKIAEAVWLPIYGESVLKKNHSGLVL